MNRNQLEKLYEVNGLRDYKLKSAEDLIKTHGIDPSEVDGYNLLDDLSRQLYEKFIINFLNGLGLDSRATLIPLGIYYVEEVEYLAKEDPQDDYYVVAGGLVLAIARNGVKTVHSSWRDEHYENLETTESKPKRYLRFEYECQGRKEWQHVLNEDTWY